MIAYLDTQVAIWLAAGQIKRISPRALALIQRSEVLLSPMVLLELEYLYEIGRSKLRAQDILRKLEAEVGVRVCEISFAEVTGTALHESWSRDPFDRMIVAQAKSNGLACLISADAQIAEHYPRAVW
jgi:PIN domain nuclease of toxin-antitoxin system